MFRLTPGCGRKQPHAWPQVKLAAECAHTSQLAAVRCCKGAKPVSCETPCSLEVQSNRAMCPGTAINAFSANWTEAHAECAARGARLCSEKELANLNVCCGDGCFLDHHCLPPPAPSERPTRVAGE